MADRKTARWWSACAVILAAVGLWITPTPAAPADEAKALARDLLADSGASGGLLVQIGCGKGELTAALSADGRFLVHALDKDPRRRG